MDVVVEQSESNTFIGTLVAEKYRVLKKLSQGGMGQVYLAQHVDLEELRAIKIVPLEIGFGEVLKQRFLNEIKMTHRVCQHNDHIVRVYDGFGFEETYGYYIMEYLQGDLLTHRIERAPGQLPILWCLQVAIEICEAMGAAHQEGVIHRDLKPDNIFLINAKGKTDFVKIVDFGIARLEDSDQRLTQTGAIVGTLLYLSPEQIVNATPDANRASIDGRCDIYALGCILHEMLLGTPPFFAEGSSPIIVNQLLMSHLMQPPPPLRDHRPEVPEALEQAVLQAMAKKPEERFPNMATFARTLQEIADILEAQSIPLNAFDEPDEETIAHNPFQRLPAHPLRNAPAIALVADTDESQPPQPPMAHHALSPPDAPADDPFDDPFDDESTVLSAPELAHELREQATQLQPTLESQATPLHATPIKTKPDLAPLTPHTRLPSGQLEDTPLPLITAHTTPSAVLSPRPDSPNRERLWLWSWGVVISIMLVLAAMTYFWQPAPPSTSTPSPPLVTKQPDQSMTPTLLQKLTAYYTSGAELFKKGETTNDDALFLQAAAKWKLILQEKNWTRTRYYPKLYLGIAGAYTKAKHLRLTKRYIGRYIKANPPGHKESSNIKTKQLPRLNQALKETRQRAIQIAQTLAQELKQGQYRKALHSYTKTLSTAPSQPSVHIRLARMVAPLFPALAQQMYLHIQSQLEPSKATMTRLLALMKQLNRQRKQQELQTLGFLNAIDKLLANAPDRARRQLTKHLRSLPVLLQPRLHQQINQWLQVLAQKDPSQGVKLLAAYEKSLALLQRKGLYPWLQKSGVSLPATHTFRQQKLLFRGITTLQGMLRQSRRAAAQGSLAKSYQLSRKAIKQWQMLAKQDIWQYTKAYTAPMLAIAQQQQNIKASLVVQKKAAALFRQGRFQRTRQAYQTLLKLLQHSPARRHWEKQYARESEMMQRGQRALAQGRKLYQNKMWNEAWAQFKLYKDLFPKAWNHAQVDHWYNIATCEAGVSWKPCHNLKHKQRKPQ